MNSAMRQQRCYRRQTPSKWVVLLTGCLLTVCHRINDVLANPQLVLWPTDTKPGPQTGPVTDGLFVPTTSALSLLHGHFDKSLAVMAGPNANECTLFINLF